MNFLPARSLNLNHDAASGFFQVSACRIRITDVFRFACPDGREHQRDHEKEDQGGGDENAADSDIIGDAAAQKGTDDAAGGAETAGPAEICAARFLAYLAAGGLQPIFQVMLAKITAPERRGTSEGS